MKTQNLVKSTKCEFCYIPANNKGLTIAIH